MSAKMFKLIAFLFTVSLASANTDESFEENSIELALKLYQNCSEDVGYSVCFKKKAITLLDELGRMDNISLFGGITINRFTANDDQPVVTEEQLDQVLPRSVDAKEVALSEILVKKVYDFIGSRSLKITLPKLWDKGSENEARTGDFDSFGGGGYGGGGGGGGKKGGKRRGGGMGMMMGMMGAASLISMKTGALFLLAGKALVVSKIALVLSLVLLLKKLSSGGGKTTQEYHHVHASGWDSHGGGNNGWSNKGWQRSADPQELAYNDYLQP